MWDMPMKVRVLGAVVLAAGLAVAGTGFLYGMPKADAGLDSAQAMYADQAIELSYNEQGQLVDRGTPEGAQAIMDLLRDDWDYPVDRSNFDPDDPLVDTRDELMFQYATITYHVLHGERNVVLAAEDVPITYRGVTYTEPGEYPIEVGAYYAQLDRNHPIERQLREGWTAQALALNAYLAGGHANQAAGELAWMTSFGMGAVGLLFALVGAGAMWVSWARPATPHAPARARRHANRRPARAARHAPPPEHEAPPLADAAPALTRRH